MIIGHARQKQQLQRFLQCKNQHGFIFFGPQFIGKYTIARRFAYHLIHQNKPIEWNVCNVTDNDLLTIAPQQVKKQNRVVTRKITIDSVRDMRTSFFLSADGDAKVLIIDCANHLTFAAQNALLKIIEEPPKNRFVILIAHKRDVILETVSSRCAVMPFYLVEEKEIDVIYHDDIYRDHAYGRPGLIHAMHEKQYVRDVIVESTEILQQLSQMKMYKRIEYIKSLLNKSDEEIDLFFLVWIYRIRAAAYRTQKLHLLKVAQNIESKLHVLHTTNINKRLAIENILLNM